jgi:hypothetical protein
MLIRKIVSAAVVVLAASAISPGLFATAPEHTVSLTFNGPVGLPGVTLPAGTYVFERLDMADRINVVRVFARNRSSVYVTTFTKVVPRPSNLPTKQIVTFREAKKGEAPKIAAWFPAGENIGHQFVY